MKKDVKEYYKLISYGRLVDYLLLKHNVALEFDKFKSIILTEEFIEIFKTMIDNINESNINYPYISYINATEVLSYISKNTNFNVDELIKKVYSMNGFSYDKYYHEYMSKQSFINLESLKNTTMWSVEEIEESLLYDFIVTISLNADEDDFLHNYLNDFIFNKNAVLSLNKIILENDRLLIDSEIKRRIRTIVKANLKIMENESDRKEMIDLYALKNFKATDNIDFNSRELDIFKELNMNILNKLNNQKYNAFNIKSIHQYYDYLVVESYINGNNSKNHKDIILENLHFYIDNALFISLKNKKKIIELLSEKKQALSSYEKEKLYSYIEKVNLKNTSKDDILYEFKTRSNILTYIKAMIQMKQGDDTLYKKVLSSKNQDVYNMEILIKDEDFFNSNIVYANITSFQYCLNKFMKEYPSMFLNDVILNRTLLILNKYDGLDAKVLKKKLDKIKKA